MQTNFEVTVENKRDLHPRSGSLNSIGSGRCLAGWLLLVSILVVQLSTPRAGWAESASPSADAFDAAFPDDADEIPIIHNKKQSREGRFEFTAFFNTSLIDKYSQHVGAQGAITYHFIDELALELGGGYLSGKETGIVGQARLQKLSDGESQGSDPDLPDMTQMTYLATAHLLFTPLYGKLNFVSELDVNMDLFFLAGGGVVGTQRSTSEKAPDADLGKTINVAGEPLPTISGGMGLRFYLYEDFALRLGFRGLMYWEDFEFRRQITGDNNNAQITSKVEDDFIWNFLFFAGVSYIL